MAEPPPRYVPVPATVAGLYLGRAPKGDVGLTSLRATFVSLAAGIVVGGALAALDLLNPASAFRVWPRPPVGVVAGATALLGTFVGHWVVTSGPLRPVSRRSRSLDGRQHRG